MSTALPSAAAGRRERNKLAKLERITAAASELFAEHGVDDVTTQQIAELADIGTGTLFLYARTKSELLLLVQNANYLGALERGRAAAQEISDPVDALMALATPIVECNRAQVENGRTYLREMVYGDPEEPRHAEALGIVAGTEEAVAALLQREGRVDAERAAILAHVLSAILLLSMSLSANAGASIDEILGGVRRQVEAILP